VTAVVLLLALALVFQFALGGVAAWLMGTKGRSEFGGFLLGFFLSGVGVLVAAMMPRTEEEEIRNAKRIAQVVGQTKEASEGERTCPRCAETVKAKATLCRFCGSELEPIAQPVIDRQGGAEHEPSSVVHGAPLDLGEYGCRRCRWSFETADKLEIHNRNFHGGRKEPNPVPSPPARPPTPHVFATTPPPDDGPQCPRCGYRFHTNDQLALHWRNFHQDLGLMDDYRNRSTQSK